MLFRASRKLPLRELHLLQDLRQLDLLHQGQLRRGAPVVQVPQEPRRPKGQGVEVLRGRAVRVALRGQLRTEPLGLPRRHQQGQAHEPQELPGLLVVPGRGLHQPARLKG